ncbi:hypothetical protein BABINDRAFT_12444 [Babjeviella inositovora NRRL Y-12698]|uniref:Uncharacterized protein n=1 Tax=Babjeviella inositovora NRRL Y-12698 TaxID=984486 RepID=A0A1E3QU26_9ASCO|nr:uncharacterized protein BABINDRAFT_12444 [Babjeviella inositovora NRRL Y-12698]ODQ81195.1 hypothetical protein BABINDRAFT_12444 [Babjeviella inositovora NRRL Y-12698]
MLEDLFQLEFQSDSPTRFNPGAAELDLYDGDNGIAFDKELAKLLNPKKNQYDKILTVLEASVFSEHGFNEDIATRRLAKVPDDAVFSDLITLAAIAGHWTISSRISDNSSANPLPINQRAISLLQRYLDAVMMGSRTVLTESAEVIYNSNSQTSDIDLEVTQEVELLDGKVLGDDDKAIIKERLYALVKSLVFPKSVSAMRRLQASRGRITRSATIPEISAKSYQEKVTAEGDLLEGASPEFAMKSPKRPATEDLMISPKKVKPNEFSSPHGSLASNDSFISPSKGALMLDLGRQKMSAESLKAAQMLQDSQDFEETKDVIRTISGQYLLSHTLKDIWQLFKWTFSCATSEKLVHHALWNTYRPISHFVVQVFRLQLNEKIAEMNDLNTVHRGWQNVPRGYREVVVMELQDMFWHQLLKALGTFSSEWCEKACALVFFTHWPGMRPLYQQEVTQAPGVVLEVIAMKGKYNVETIRLRRDLCVMLYVGMDAVWFASEGMNRRSYAVDPQEWVLAVAATVAKMPLREFREFFTLSDESAPKEQEFLFKVGILYTDGYSNLFGAFGKELSLERGEDTDIFAVLADLKPNYRLNYEGHLLDQTNKIVIVIFMVVQVWSCSWNGDVSVAARSKFLNLAARGDIARQEWLEVHAEQGDDSDSTVRDSEEECQILIGATQRETKKCDKEWPLQLANMLRCQPGWDYERGDVNEGFADAFEEAILEFEL